MKHGAVSTYERGKCRCEPCRAAKAAKVRRLSQRPPRDNRRFPVSPVIRAAVLRYGSLNNMPNTYMRRALIAARNEKTDGCISAVCADRYAVALGKHPAELWPDWYAYPEAG